MKISSIYVMLTLITLPHAHAQNGIDKTITDLEIRSIQSGNLPQLKAELEKGTGKAIRVTLDTSSIKKAGAAASDDLRGLTFRFGEALHNEFAKDPKFKDLVKTKVDEVSFKYIDKGPAKFAYDKKSHILSMNAPYGMTDWQEVGPLAAGIRKALK